MQSVFLQRRLRPQEREGLTLDVEKWVYLKVKANITLHSVKSSADAKCLLLYLFLFIYFFNFKVTVLNHEEFIYESTCNYSLNAPEKRLSTSTSLHKVLLCLLRHPAVIKYSSAKKQPNNRGQLLHKHTWFSPRCYSHTLVARCNEKKGQYQCKRRAHTHCSRHTCRCVFYILSILGSLLQLHRHRARALTFSTRRFFLHKAKNKSGE